MGDRGPSLGNAMLWQHCFCSAAWRSRQVAEADCSPVGAACDQRCEHASLATAGNAHRSRTRFCKWVDVAG